LFCCAFKSGKDELLETNCDSREPAAMPLWNLVLSGYPGSGKTVLARRLVSENSNFVRLSVDDLRNMFFSPIEPPKDDEFLYSCLASLRDLVLRSGRSVVLDSTAPRNTTRQFLLNTKVEGAIRLIVLLMVEKNELEGRNRERGIMGAVEAWDKTWENPLGNMPVMKFRNNSVAEFETSYYILTDLLRSKVNPYRRRFTANLFPRI
jgi:predicted kinase